MGELETKVVDGNGELASDGIQERQETVVEAGVGPKPTRLLIGIPTYGKPDSAFAIDSLGALLYHIGRRHPEITEVAVQKDVRTYRQEARRAIVEGAFEFQATHLLMLDDDHTFDATVFDKLWENRDKKVVSALYMTRGYPCVPCIFRSTVQGTASIYYYPENELFQVDVVGFGFVLFDMEVFTRINRPWFNLGFGFGEDAAFCEMLRAAGISVYCHTGAKIGHLFDQPRVLTEQDFLQNRNLLNARVEESKLLPEISPDRQRVDAAKGADPWWERFRPSHIRRWFYRTGRVAHPGQEASVPSGVQEVERWPQTDDSTQATPGP